MRFLLVVVFSLIGFFGNSLTVLANAQDVQQHPWLKEYDKYTRHGDVFIVKKIEVSCQSYSSFLVDLTGRKLTPPYKDIADFSEGLAEFASKENGVDGKSLHGFINERGEEVVPARYTGTDKFVNGKTWVIYPIGAQYGLSFIDKKGNELYKVPVNYFKNDFLISKASVDHVCNQDTKEDIIWWKKGKIFLLNWNFSRFNREEIKKSEGIYHFLYEGKYGIIDKDMIIRVPVVLDGIDPKYKFSGQGLERVQYGEKFGFINRHTGNLVTPIIYTDTRKPTAGLFWVKKDGKWGCIDINGKTRIPFLYDEATGFTAEDRSAVAINGKFGHIDKKGKIRTPLKYEFASYFNHGISMIRIGDKYGYMKVDGTFITGIVYDNALPFDHETTTADRHGIRYEIKQDGSESFVGFTPVVDALLIFLGVVIFVWLNGKFGIVQQYFKKKK